MRFAVSTRHIALKCSGSAAAVRPGTDPVLRHQGTVASSRSDHDTVTVEFSGGFLRCTDLAVW